MLRENYIIRPVNSAAALDRNLTTIIIVIMNKSLFPLLLTLFFNRAQMLFDFRLNKAVINTILSTKNK